MTALLAGGVAVASHDAVGSHDLPPGPCRAEPLPGRAQAGVSTTALGATPARYEVGAPSGGRVERVMMLIHGGAWEKIGQATLNSMAREGSRWQAAGWETVNADYRPCAHSLRDVEATYRAIRASVGPGTPICISGQSAGAHLALMLAARRRDVACVLAAAPPTDLRTMASQGERYAGHGVAPEHLDEGAAWVQEKGRTAFGARSAATMSTVNYAARIRAPVFLSAAAEDDLVPVAQQYEMARALRAAGRTVQLDVLAPGSTGYVHAAVSNVALAALQQRIARFVAPWGRGPALGLSAERLSATGAER